MKNKKLLFGVCLSLLVGAAALTTASALSATEPQNDLMMANIEALTSNEGPAACADYGYKQWSFERPSPDALYLGFKDCWCEDRKGYEPVACKSN